jgi:hypothetical protein
VQDSESESSDEDEVDKPRKHRKKRRTRADLDADALRKLATEKSSTAGDKAAEAAAEQTKLFTAILTATSKQGTQAPVKSEDAKELDKLRMQNMVQNMVGQNMMGQMGSSVGMYPGGMGYHQVIVCVCVCLCEVHYMCDCLSVCLSVCVCVCVCVCDYVCMFTCVHVCRGSTSNNRRPRGSTTTSPPGTISTRLKRPLPITTHSPTQERWRCTIRMLIRVNRHSMRRGGATSKCSRRGTANQPSRRGHSTVTR